MDSHPVTRQGLARLIDHEPDLQVCGDADTAAKALKRIRVAQPDLVLADISLPDCPGLALVKELHALHPRLPLLVVSANEETLYAERVLRAGGRGYIMKQEDGRILLRAIRQVLSGRIYASESISNKILEIFSGHGDAVAHSPVERLSDREFEVFELIGQGKSTRDIASQLHLSAKTVEVHRTNMNHKLKLSRGTSLVGYAVQWTEVQNPP